MPKSWKPSDIPKSPDDQETTDVPKVWVSTDDPPDTDVPEEEEED